MGRPKAQLQEMVGRYHIMERGGKTFRGVVSDVHAYSEAGDAITRFSYEWSLVSTRTGEWVPPESNYIEFVGPFNLTRRRGSNSEVYTSTELGAATHRFLTPDHTDAISSEVLTEGGL